jgi:hypothetical protein
MDKKKILLVNLSKGRTGQLNMQLLGIIFVMKFQAAAMSRANVPEKERGDFALYVDEFQNFSTDSFATILSEARKYHLNLIAANQFTTQLSEAIRYAVFGNVGTTIAFRVGDRDAEALKKYFQPSFDESDILRVPNYNAIVRTMVGGVPTLPFSMATLPPLGSPNMRLSEALKQLSAAKYGRPKVVVEEEIFARMATKTDTTLKPGFTTPNMSQSPWGANASSGFGSPAFTPPAGQFSKGYMGPTPGTGMVTPDGKKQQPSFLDEWLAKRQVGTGNASTPQTGTSSFAPQGSIQAVPGSYPFSTDMGASTLGSRQPDDAYRQKVTDATPSPANPADSISIDSEGTLRIR